MLKKIINSIFIRSEKREGVKEHINSGTLSQLENCCKNLHSKSSDLLLWKWDERFNMSLAEFTKKHSAKIHSIISKEFDTSWDSKTIKKAPKIVRKIDSALSGMRENQILFTTNPDSEIILFAAWWPWGNNEEISIRIGIKCQEKTTMSEIEIALNIKKWFGLE